MPTVKNLNRIGEAAEFFTQWRECGFNTQQSVATEIGVSLDTVKSWSIGRTPIPMYARRALMRVIHAYG